jgi:alpha-L-arabinofuranosidase
MKKLLTKISTFMVAMLVATITFAQPYVVKVDKPIADIQPTMWGVFFEDINFAADGGLYAEFIKNRSFEFDNPLMAWIQPNSNRHSLNGNSGIGRIMKSGSGPNANYLRVEVQNPERYQLINEGFRGMGVKKDAGYNLSVNIRQLDPGISKINFQLIDKEDAILGSASIVPDSKTWKKYTANFKSNTTDPKARLKITFEGRGNIDLDMISLFPDDTWKGRPNGLRKDLVQLLADMKPGLFRFPGGCIVEGRTLENRYQWKHTVGNIEDRTLIINRWNTEFRHRSTPDYFQSMGLGFYEYFLLAADLGAEPLPILSCGMACQYNTGVLVPLDELQPYIDDALDLIEFANGSVDTKWGKLRADMGHPAPFNMKYIGIGNEQWGPEYFERLEMFNKAIKAKHPEIIIVSGTGPSPDGEHFDYAEKELRRLNAEIVDEHYYRPPQWFLDNAARYDSYDRNAYKIFAGEYASHIGDDPEPESRNNWLSALSEAAFMTGLERNADIVTMTSYAPLFAHVEAWQWRPDMIWFDNLRSMGTPNYYVQKLFSTNRGDQVLSILDNGKPLVGQDKIYASAVYDKAKKEVIIKVANVSENHVQKDVRLDGVKRVNANAKRIVLRSDDFKDFNNLDNPMKIYPQEESLKVRGNTLKMDLLPYSFIVYVIKTS